MTLIGLAAKNAILIVEFAKMEVDKGVDVVVAAKNAAMLRFRPILMTSLAFVLGMLPLGSWHPDRGRPAAIRSGPVCSSV